MLSHFSDERLLNEYPFSLSMEEGLDEFEGIDVSDLVDFEDEEEVDDFAKLVQFTDDHLVLLEIHDPASRDHSERVAIYCAQMSNYLEDLYEVDKFLLHYSALLHDIGKTTIPQEILQKPGKLSAVHRIMVETHAASGYSMIMDVLGFMDLGEAVLYHHEHIDGTGYASMEGEEIPFISRIIAVADSYDAMTTRTYKKTMSPQEAIDELKSLAGTKYDEQCVNALESALKDLEFIEA